jgi:hypothetical protein
MPNINTIIYPPLPSSFEQLAVAASPVPFTASKYSYKGTTGDTQKRPRQANLARVTVETASIRYTVDGTTPTSSVGHLVASGTTFDVFGWDAIKAFRAIQAVGAAQISVTYYGN